MAFAGSSSDEEDMSAFYNRSLPPPKSCMDDTQASISASSSSKKRGGSGGLAPSKSTVYVSNLDYSLTNSDLFTIFSTFGKVARVTVMKDRESRKSKGVAFVLFTKQKDAVAAVQQMQGKSLNGRRLNVSVAADNGRAPEFIRRRVYKDKSRCYECGEAGHLSYECPRNQLGNRERPQPKKPRKAHTKREDDAAASMPWDEENEAEAEAEAVFEDDNWASVVDPRGMHDMVSVPGLSRRSGAQQQPKRPKYFSDDESDPDD